MKQRSLTNGRKLSSSSTTDSFTVRSHTSTESVPIAALLPSIAMATTSHHQSKLVQDERGIGVALFPAPSQSSPPPPAGTSHSLRGQGEGASCPIGLSPLSITSRSLKAHFTCSIIYHISVPAVFINVVEPSVRTLTGGNHRGSVIGGKTPTVPDSVCISPQSGGVGGVEGVWRPEGGLDKELRPQRLKLTRYHTLILHPSG